jgi:hypothetical protein
LGNTNQEYSDKIKWHPGFYGAAELEFRKNKDDLEFEREYNLSKEPLRTDLLIVKKHADVQIENEIGWIFKRFNIIEYKSPDDGMSIDDYYKTVGYACLYKGLGETVNAIPADELTVSMFRETYPRELFAQLKKQGAQIEERFPGIYYVTGGTLFDTQIVVTNQLNKETHSSLRVLSKDAQAEDIRLFLEEAEKLKQPGDRNNISAVLRVSVDANQSVYDRVKEDETMGDALRELMKDELEEAHANGMEEGMQRGMERGMERGIQRGMEEGILSSISNLMKSMKLTAEQAMDALGIPKNERASYNAKLIK